MTGAERPIIEVEAMGFRYGEVEAVAGVSLEVRRGEMFGLIGPDGAGKTTTLRVILGLLRPRSGRVSTVGLDPYRQGRALSRHVGYLSQRFSLYGDLSVDENIGFFATLHGAERWRARRAELLQLLNLARFGGRLADHLSGGMKQKLALACTLIHTPELLVLDEPTTGVDPVSRREFWKILAHLQASGLTILVTTPYLDEAERCQRVALLHGGRILSMDTPARLRASLETWFIEVVARPAGRAAAILAARADVADVVTFGERLHARMRTHAGEGERQPTLETLRRALTGEGLDVLALRPIEPTLEDVFIASVPAAEGLQP